MDLTKQQQVIVDLNKGQHLVLAPPGTGKTELLVQRLSQAIENGVDQHTMICLTFTNRAAKNMLDRVEREVGKHDVFIGNIHSFCNIFLRKNNNFLGGICLSVTFLKPHLLYLLYIYLFIIKLNFTLFYFISTIFLVSTKSPACSL